MGKNRLRRGYFYPPYRVKTRYEKYLEGVDLQKLKAIVAASGVQDEELGPVFDNVIRNAGLARLAFSYSDAEADPILDDWVVNTQGVIHKTLHQKPTGRPKTGIWAFWAAFMYRSELRAYKKLTAIHKLSEITSTMLNPKTRLPKNCQYCAKRY